MLLFNSIPGNAFSKFIIKSKFTSDAYEKVIETYGLDKPIIERLQLLYC